MTDTQPYVRADEHGVLRVGNTRVMLEGIIYGFREGHSPESIRSQYPSLTLEEVYGAIAYCLAHPEQIDEYLKKQDSVWNEARARQQKNLPPAVARLRSIAKGKAQEQKGRHKPHESPALFGRS